MKNVKTGYVHGTIGTTMLKTAASMIPATLAISGYHVADTYFVAKLGTMPLAAMGFTFPMIMLISCIYRGIAVGGMTPLAHAVGKRKMGTAAKIASSSLLLIIVCSVFVGIFGLLSMKWVFSCFGAGGEVMPMILSYMSIWYLGNLSVALAMTCNNFLIAMGATKSASGLMVAGMLLNVILDPIFIFGFGGIPAMGIGGAALATVLAQIISGTVLLLTLHLKFRLLTLRILNLRLLKVAWLIIIRISIPSIIGILMLPIGNGIITRIGAEFGADVVAACAAAGRLEMVAFIVPMSLGMALMPMIGQNFGAKHYDRINQCRRFAVRFAVIFELFMALIYFFLAPYLSGLFSEDPKLLEIMTVYLRIIPFGFGMMEVHRYCGFIYTGCNKPAAAAWLNALRLFALLVPLSLLALYFQSLNGLFAARLVSDILSGLVGLWLVRRMTLKLLSQK
ncbi:MAG: MATE family efflux transporter [Victivallales bacterium]